MSELADRIAELLERELEGLPCETLARKLGRRTSTVRRALHADARFTATGSYRHRRWRTDNRALADGTRDGLQDDASPGRHEAVTPTEASEQEPTSAGTGFTTTDYFVAQPASPEKGACEGEPGQISTPEPGTGQEDGDDIDKDGDDIDLLVALADEDAR